MEPVEWIWMNGEFVPWDDAQVHVLTHALHYGYGVFEGIRAYETRNGRVAALRLSDHMLRLRRSGKAYHIDIPYSQQQLVEATKELIRRNHMKSGYIRPLAYSGYGEMGLNPLNSEIDVSIAAWPWGLYLGEEGIKQGVRASISSYRRLDHNIAPPAAKVSGNYVNSILAKIEATQAGFDEAIMLNSNGFVADGTSQNLFIVRDRVVYTPPLHAGCLEGITRDCAIRIARDLGYEVRETDLVRTDLFLADEAFLTGTAAEIVPIREVSGYELGEPGPATKKIQEVFFAAIKGELAAYSPWLEYV